MIEKDLYRLLQFRGRTGNMTYKKLFETRLVEAIKQRDEANEKLKKESNKTFFIDLVKKDAEVFFQRLDLENIKCLELSFSKQDSKFISDDGHVNYQKIQETFDLNNINHLVWMKFAKGKGKMADYRYLGVVAASNDVNFSKYDTTSGKLVYGSGLEWDESFVLIYPLTGITDGMRKDIECGLGNYLIEKEIPIIDYYSHRMQ